MEELEPNLCVPRPSPYPPSRLADTSVSLEVTPERVAERDREPIRNRQMKSSKIQISSSTCGAQVQTSVGDDCPIPPSLLSAPHINSSSRLYNKLTTFKQHKQRLPPAAQAKSNLSNDGQGLPHCTTQHKSSRQTVSSVCSSDAMDLESMASVSTKPLQEVNIPRHKSRYSDLPAVDISNESFQRLAFKPRKKEIDKKSGKKKTAATGREVTEAPSIMEFFSPELEWDEAEWNIEAPPPSDGHTPENDRSQLTYATVSDDAAFTLYRHMQMWKQ